MFFVLLQAENRPKNNSRFIFLADSHKAVCDLPAILTHISNILQKTPSPSNQPVSSAQQKFYKTKKNNMKNKYKPLIF